MRHRDDDDELSDARLELEQLEPYRFSLLRARRLRLDLDDRLVQPLNLELALLLDRLDRRAAAVPALERAARARRHAQLARVRLREHVAAQEAP